MVHEGFPGEAGVRNRAFETGREVVGRHVAEGFTIIGHVRDELERRIWVCAIVQDAAQGFRKELSDNIVVGAATDRRIGASVLATIGRSERGVGGVVGQDARRGIHVAAKAVEQHGTRVARAENTAALRGLTAGIDAVAIRHEHVPAVRDRARFVASVGLDLAEQRLAEDANPVVDLVVAAGKSVIPRQRQDQVQVGVVISDRTGSGLLPGETIQLAIVETDCTPALGEVVAGPDGTIGIGVDVVTGTTEGRAGAISKYAVDVSHVNRVAGGATREDDTRSSAEERGACHQRIGQTICVPVAIALIVGFTRVHRHGEADVAAAVGEVGAHDARQLVFEAVAFLGDAHLAIEFEALEILLKDEVGHTGHGVGTIGCRGTAGDDLDTLDRGRRNGADVGHARCVRRRRATPVDQHERTVGTDAAQRDGRRARRVGRGRLNVSTGRRRLRRGELRQLVQVGFECRGRGLLEQGFVDGDDGAVALEILALNARAGNDDAFANFGLVQNVRATLRIRIRSDLALGHDRRSQSDGAGPTCEQQGLEDPVLVKTLHFVLPSQ